MVLRETPLTADSATATPAEDDDALRKRLLSRIAVAGVVIAGLLGGLAVYDSLNRPQIPAMPPMAAAPADVVPVQEEKKAPVEESPVVAEKMEGDKIANKVEEVAPVQSAASPQVPEKSETPIGPPVVEKPLKPARPITPPAAARQATARPSPLATMPPRPDAQQEIARTMPEGTSSPSSPQSRSQAASRPQFPPQQEAATRHAPASRPLSQAAESARRFLVQVGVFSNHANAEELMHKLHVAGIPAQIESRVQVGPFASRMEADAARAKLKAMGLDEGLLVRR